MKKKIGNVTKKVDELTDIVDVIIRKVGVYTASLNICSIVYSKLDGVYLIQRHVVTDPYFAVTYLDITHPVFSRDLHCRIGLNRYIVLLFWKLSILFLFSKM